ncbi:hypothetical protein [Guptibacillus algicola]|uniref:hypothetical protein n=1 Tax=Guptibacillus algicola TaxID=225844 RepID=UPI001CD3AF54|nr:hypothetical protein [Alkalihalobacillus algicola]MCA0987169.1 hypothetical protein [Alkalihalobacillus algicola]
MVLKSKLTYLLLVFVLILSACGQNEEGASEENSKEEETTQQDSNDGSSAEKEGENTAEEDADFVTAYKEGKDELAKASEGEEVDYQSVIDLYTNDLQPLVAKRDESIDQQITTALEAGKNGEMDGAVVKQIFDKLTQKVFYLTVKHEFNEINENWGNTEEVNAEIEEAKEYYAVLKETVEKRDAAYETTMVDQIDAGFSEIEKAVENDDQLGFQLGKQLVDKTLMKTFYLAAGAMPNGYATKAAEAAKEDVKEAKVQQAEGWAFYQSISSYLNEYAKEDASIIEENFNLENDVKNLDPEAVNHAFVRGFAKVALHEYEESEENWGEDKSTITALEGALFIDLIASDIKSMEGEEAYTTLNELAQSYLEAVKADEKEQAMEDLKKLEERLNTIIENAQ